MKKREKSSLRIILPMLPLLLAGLCPPALAATLPADAEQSAASLLVRLCRAETLAAPLIAKGMDEATAFAFAWVALCQEEAGKGAADELLEELVNRNRLEEALKTLTPEQMQDLAAALDARAGGKRANAYSFTIIRQVLSRLLANENAAEVLPCASGMTSSRDGRLSGSTARSAAQMPSVRWLEQFSGSLLQHEPALPAFQPPPAPAGMPKPNRVRKPTKKDEDEELAESYDLPFAQATTEGTASLSAAALSSLGGGGSAPAPLATAVDTPEPKTLEVADGKTQSVMAPTSVHSVTLGSGSTLYVADELTLSHELKVQDDSRLIVKDGGVVQLGTYSDSQSAATNKNVALLFNALLHSATTEGSGVVKIDSVSVQFGDGSAYNLADAKTGLNAVFDARYEIAKNLQLQNYNQGLAHSKNPTQVPASLWKISESGNVHVMGDFSLSSYQQMDVKGGTLVVDGNTYLGHSDTSADYHAVLKIADGSYVKLKNIGDARTDGNGKSELVMTGGELVFTADGNVVTNKLGSITLSGGELVADGHSWVLNHNATIGSDAGLTIRTDAAHSVTLGVDGTTTTLAGQVAVSEGSNAVLNGTYAGTGTVELEDGATLTLGQNFSTAADSSVGLSGTGTVQVNWTGTLGSIDNGFTDAYHMNYTPSGLTGALNLEHAEGLVWKDAAGNTLHDVSYEKGVLTGHLAADPTVYHIVTAGHQAEYDTDGNAEGATSFLMYNDGKLFIGENHSVSAAQVTLDGHTLTLEGSGRYDLGTISKVQDIKLPSNLVLGDDWTGIIKLDGPEKALDVSSASHDTWGLDGEGYRWDSMVKLDAETGKALSWLELKGVKSYFTPNNHTIAANLMLAEGTALNVSNGFSTRDITFNGKVAGSGTFENSNAGTAVDKYTFAGDISQWTGQFLKTTGGNGLPDTER